jgi:hypothetical protein
MATTVRTSLPILLLNIQSWVRSLNLVPDPTAVKMWLGRKPPRPNQADHTIYLWPKNQSVKKTFGNAAGRIDTRVNRRVIVLAFSRVDFDAMDQADGVLTDPTYGHLVFEHSLYDALECYLPLDGSGNALVEQPIRLESTAETERVNEETPDGWVSSALEFSVSFELALNQSRQ